MSLITSIKNYGKEITSSRASWTDFTKDVAKVFNNQTLLDYTTAFNNFEDYILYTPKWTIGGAAFSGIMRTNHSLSVEATHYPVQSGSVMTDHAILFPAELDIEVMVSDAEVYARSIKTGNRLFDTVLDVYNKATSIIPITNFFAPPGQPALTGDRGISAWTLFANMIIARVPVDIVTRLGTYHNMLLVHAETPDDRQTLHGLNCTLHFEQIDVAQVAEVQVSARSQTTGSSNSGAQPVDTDSPANNQSILSAINDSIGGK